MEKPLKGIPKHSVIIDNVFLWADSKEEALENLRLTLESCREKGIKLNLDKCKFVVSKVKYYGHLIRQSGITPNEQKTVNDMVSLQNKKKVQTFLGLVNYLGKFFPHLLELTSPLRQLLKSDVQWMWDATNYKIFPDIKNFITNILENVLQFYNVVKLVNAPVDASQHAGSSLIARQRPH